MGILGSIFGFIAKPLDTVLEKMLPNKEQRDKFKHELQLETMRIPFEQQKMFEQRVMKEMENPNLLRDSVRPIITYTCWALYCYVKIVTVVVVSKAYLPMLAKIAADDAVTGAVALYRLPQIKEMLGGFISSIFTVYDLYIMLTILGFWFGSKLLERTIDKIAKTGGIASVFMGLKKGIANTLGAENEEEKP